MTKCTEAKDCDHAPTVLQLRCPCGQFVTDAALAPNAHLGDVSCDAEKAVLTEALDLELEAVESSINNLDQCPSDHHCNDVTRVYDRLLRQCQDLERILADTSPAAAALLAQGERQRVRVATILNRHVDGCLQCGESVSADGLCELGGTLNDTCAALAPGEAK